MLWFLTSEFGFVLWLSVRVVTGIFVEVKHGIDSGTKIFRRWTWSIIVRRWLVLSGR
jgi:hypothetical protein